MATDWTALELEFVNGSMSYKELSERYGIKEGTVRQRANRNGWVEKRNALSKSVTEKAQAEHIEKRVDELTKFNEDDLKVARAIRAKIAKKIALSDDLSAQELRALAGAHEAAQRVGRLAMGATTENTGVSAPNGGPVESKTTIEKIDLSNMSDEAIERLERAAMAAAAAGGAGGEG